MLRSIYLGIGWILVAGVFYISLIPHPPEPVSFEGVDKLEHALAYATLMLIFCQVYLSPNTRKILFVCFVAMGVGIEFLQGLSGYRFFEYADMLANTTGVILGWGLAQTRLGNLLSTIENYAHH
ncbi:MAG: VanZ family protein [Gallionellaceae bacterium]|jgi:VanZ family protein